MAEGPENLILRYLRRIDQGMDDLKADMQEVKERLVTLEANYASMSRRLDRLDERGTRIGRRPDPVETPTGWDQAAMVVRPHPLLATAQVLKLARNAGLS